MGRGGESGNIEATRDGAFFIHLRIPDGLDLVDVVPLGERVEDGVHCIEHGHDLHGGDATTDFCERHHVGEQYRNTVEHLQLMERGGW